MLLFCSCIFISFVAKADSNTIESTRSKTGNFNLEKPLSNKLKDRFSNDKVVVTGKVTTSDDNESLPGVSVIIKGSSNGTVTDVQGNYKIEAESPEDILVFSYVGYLSEEVVIGNRSEINISLVLNIEQLAEVVVVGYGTQRKSDLTGSIASIKSGDLERINATSLDQALQGQAAGVLVTSNNGEPGGGISVKIRGASSINSSNEPLYVIDGVPFFPSDDETNPGFDGSNTVEAGNNSNPLAFFNPNDIESVEVLKDASATAIYGSRGANGVILITTKQGKKGKANIDFQYWTGIQEMTEKPKLLSAEQILRLQNESRINNDDVPLWTEAQIDSISGLPQTDWLDEITQTGLSHNFQLTISGGSDKTRYAVSGNYFDQKGVIKNTSFNRYTFRTNVNTDVFKKLVAGVNLNISRSINNSIEQNATGGSRNNSSVFTSAMRFVPFNPRYVTEENIELFRNPEQLVIGQYAPHLFEFADLENPLTTLNEIDFNTTNDRFFGNFYLDYNIIPGLNLRSSIGATVNYSDRNLFYSSLSAKGADANGIANLNSSKSTQWVNSNTLTYNKKIGSAHYLTTMIGMEIQERIYERQGIRANDIPNDELSYNGLAAFSNISNANSNKNRWQLASYFARVNYNLLDRYLVTATFRADGSSKFGPDNKFGYFPSFALGWRVSEEPFFQGAKSVVHEFKLRGSYGRTGNQEIGLYRSLSRWSTNQVVLDDELVIGANSSISNEGLKWETSNQFNAGFNLQFFRGRLSLEGDYYYIRTNDLLLEVQLPSYTGFTSALDNIGEVENQGVELSINTTNIDKKVRWTTSFNISANRNKVLDLGESDDLVAGSATGQDFLKSGSTHRLRVGYPIGSFYGFVQEGIWQSQEQIEQVGTDPDAKPGDIRYADLDQDGRVTNLDQTIIGDANPDFSWGITNRFEFYGFDFSFIFVGVHGQDILNVNRALMLRVNGNSNVYNEVLNRWTAGNTDATVERAGSVNNTNIDTRLLEDGSFVRMKNIMLGYTIPTGKVSWLRMARIYVAADNLLTFTNYSGFDPEVSSYGNNATSAGVDQSAYPIPRFYRIGVNVGF